MIDHSYRPVEETHQMTIMNKVRSRLGDSPPAVVIRMEVGTQDQVRDLKLTW